MKPNLFPEDLLPIKNIEGTVAVRRGFDGSLEMQKEMPDLLSSIFSLKVTFVVK